MAEKTLEERVVDLEQQVAFLILMNNWHQGSDHPHRQRRLPDAIGKPLSESWVPTVQPKEAKP